MLQQQLVLKATTGQNHLANPQIPGELANRFGEGQVKTQGNGAGRHPSGEIREHPIEQRTPIQLPWRLP
jgi:hypothetical protein